VAERHVAAPPSTNCPNAVAMDVRAVMCRTRRSVVMISTGNENYLFSSHLAYKPVGYIDSSRPITCKLVSKWFRFAGALEWRSQDDFDQIIDLTKYLFIIILPV
jgi:hypothetical protein